MNLGIKRDQILKRPIKLPAQNRQKICDWPGEVIEVNAKLDLPCRTL